MNEFIVPPVIYDHPKVNKILGEDWLESQVDAAQVTKKGKQPLHPSRMSPAFGWVKHPLVKEAKNRDEDRRTPILDSLEVDLRNLRNTPLPDTLGSRLRDDQQFEKAAYELRIASGFSMLRHFIWWIPSVNWRHPEFIVLANESDLVAVECKKRNAKDGYEQEGGRFWKHLQYRLRKDMERASLNYWVKVTSQDARLEDVEALVTEAVSAMQSNENGSVECLDARYHVEYTKLVEPGGRLSMDVIQMFPRGHYGLNTGKQTRDQVMVGPVENPKLLRFEIIDNPDNRIKGIIRNLKTAAKQVVLGLPNLVYIDVNLPDYEQEQAEFGNIINAVRTELERRHRYITAVVLTNIYPALSLDEHLGWRVRAEYVAQPQPKSIIHENLKFPRDTGGTGFIRGELTQSL